MSFDKLPADKQPVNISIIIPVLNEAEIIVSALQQLQCLFKDISCKEKPEIIVVDGGSTDDTVDLASSLADKTLVSPKGRALQMNTGAQAATGRYLLFLHSDTLLPKDFSLVLDSWQQLPPLWGFFRVRLSGRHPLLRIVETLMNWRSRLTGIGTGDQAIFVRRDCFNQVGGFPEIPLMEDISLCRRLKKQARPRWVSQAVTTSSRRWEEKGILRTIWLMWQLRLAYYFGTSPQHLAKRYL